MIKLSILKENPKNPRKISEENLEKLCKSIKSFEKMLEMRPIVVDENNVVLGGNMRLKSLKKLGYKEIPDEWVKKVENLSEKEKRQFLLKDNIEYGEFDEDILKLEFDEIELEEFDLNLELDMDFKDEEEIKEDECPALKKESIVKIGDLWLLGNHRLKCGDSTIQTDVEDLMGGEKADMVLTDPPYFGDVSNKWDNQWKSWKEFQSFIQESIFIQESNIYCIFGNWKSSNAIYKQAIENKLYFLQEIIWMKPSSQGMLKYFPKITEYMQIFYKDKEKIINNCEKCRISIEEDFLPKSDLRLNLIKQAREGKFNNSKDKRRIADKKIANYGVKPKNVWYCKNMNGGYGFSSNKKNEEYSEHPTIKPIEILIRIIKAFCNKNDLILDLFGGSGSTLIACEQLNRSCFIQEICPIYSQVIIDRYKNFKKNNGKDIFLLKNGEKIPYKDVIKNHKY